MLARMAVPGLALALSGCSYDFWQDKLVPERESAFASQYMDAVIALDAEYMKAHAHSSFKSKLTDELMAELSTWVPDGERLSTELAGWHINITNSNWRGSFSFEYEYTDGWAVGSVIVARTGDELSIVGFDFYRTEASQRELTSFSAADLTPPKVLGLLVTLFVPLFMIFTCYSVYKTPIPVGKKRWYFFSFVGIFGFALNWSTGAWETQVATIKLLGFGFSAASPFAPWILQFTVPIGAIAFWVMRKELMAQSVQQPDDADPGKP